MQATLAEKTVGELVVERPSRARVFEKLGIDYCCGGRIPLLTACSKGGLDVKQVLAQLEAEGTQTTSQGERNWATASLTDLADNIEHTHHAYLKEELPRLDFLTAKVANRHGERYPELITLRNAFIHFKQELDSHMVKEESILFPIFRKFDTADTLPASHCGSVNNPIRIMIAEHDNAGESMTKFRQLTNGYAPPADACNTFRAMYDGLRQLELDMHEHVHKENNILFPKALRTETMLSRQSG